MIPELSWTQGHSFPVVSGRTIFPTLAPPVSPQAPPVSPPQYSTHWYAGSSYPGPDETAQTMNVSIRVPYSAPLSDEFYYVLLSAWDSNGSYDQLGFSNTYGTWGLTYSWTSGPSDNLIYHYSSNAMALSEGATYTFSITTKGGVTQFIADQGSTQVWSLDAPTGGNYLVVSYSDSGYYNYTDYEEVWLTDTSGGSPAFDFYFYDNYWVPVGGGEYAATWTSWSSGAPSNVAVIISGNSVLVHNPLATLLFETDPTSFAASPGTINFSGQTYSNGQTAEYADGPYQATANAPTGYRFDHWEYSGSSGSGVYVASINANPTTIQVNGDGWLKAVLTVSSLSTTLNAAVSTVTAYVNQNFTINGTLNTTSGGIAGQIITLQQNVSGTWTNVSTTSTDANGNYSFSLSESTVGTYQYRTTYAGNDTYTNATSNTVSVTVTTPTPASSPAVTAQNANSLDLFVRGSDNALWYKYWTGTTWTTATSLGGNLSSAPAATSTANGVMDVFVQGSDNGLWYKTTTNNGTSWSGWNSLGGSLASSPAVTSSNGVIDVFVRGTDNALWWKTTTNNGASWSGWMPVGGQLAAGTSPAADARGPNSLDVFVHGTDNGLWYSHWNGATWSAWKSLGGSLTSSPAATSSGTGVIDVFVQGTDNALWYKTTTNGGASWSGWTPLSGVLAAGSSPAATSPGTGVIDVFVLGTDNGLWWQTSTNSGAAWSGWTSADGI